MSRTRKNQPDTALDSFSSPNLAIRRFPNYHHNFDTNSQHRSVHLNPSRLPAQVSNHGYSSHQAPQTVNHAQQERELNNLLDHEPMEICRDDGNNASQGSIKMSRSERKRLWRKNLSSEKLAKLRERDALRKRVERMNMSAEKRRDLRTKDTARKAALRKERRLSETTTTPGPAASSSNDELYESSASLKDYRRLHSGLDHTSDAYNEQGFNKISVRSLLNWSPGWWSVFISVVEHCKSNSCHTLDRDLFKKYLLFRHKTMYDVKAHYVLDNELCLKMFVVVAS